MTTEQRHLDAAPDLIDAVMGFRQWRVDRDGLQSLHVDHRWTAATIESRCTRDEHPHDSAPMPGCCCGIHAWYRRVPRLASACTADLVSGAVVLWGRIELHPTGMRGQFARIVALALPLSRGSKRQTLVDVARALGVPAVPYAAVPAVAATQGLAVPDVLKPKPARRRHGHGSPQHRVSREVRSGQLERFSD
jgi:hypothetical protein